MNEEAYFELQVILQIISKIWRGSKTVVYVSVVLASLRITYAQWMDIEVAGYN